MIIKKNGERATFNINFQSLTPHIYLCADSTLLKLTDFLLFTFGGRVKIKSVKSILKRIFIFRSPTDGDQACTLFQYYSSLFFTTFQNSLSFRLSKMSTILCHSIKKIQR